MRLLATGRSLRTGGSRWAVIGARSKQPPHSYGVADPKRTGTRKSSTAAPQQEKLPSEEADTDSAQELAAQKHKTADEPKNELHLDAHTYPIDQWTNVPETIRSKVGGRLHLQPDHPISITSRLIQSQLQAPEFSHHDGLHPVVTTAQNFDDLGFPPDHPGRSRTDTYYVNKERVLRTHTSAHQKALFNKMEEPENVRNKQQGYTLTADVYRRDTIDRTHYPIFHQMEGARVWDRRLQPPEDFVKQIWRDVEKLPKHSVKVEDPNPTTHLERNPLQSNYHTAEEVEAIASHLKKSLERVVVEVFSKAREAAIPAGDKDVDTNEPFRVRWIEAYFPFTSPSWELEVFWQGDWLELLGCGVVKQDLLVRSGVPDRLGWAFGIGLERLAMLLFEIPDIRLFWSKDPRFLTQFKAGRINKYVPFSRYPACYKDVAFWLKSSSSSAGGLAPFHENDFMELVREIGGDLIEDVKLVDEFQHPKTKRKSLCYRINYRSLERTLTNEEVNWLHESVRKTVVGKLGVDLR
jgi:phenylalanyl-tRNA synthetase alpha chain